MGSSLLLSLDGMRRGIDNLLGYMFSFLLIGISWLVDRQFCLHRLWYRFMNLNAAEVVTKAWLTGNIIIEDRRV